MKGLLEAPPTLALSGVALDRTFPFHILVDARLRVLAVGPALRKLLPQMVPGDALADHLQASQPAGAASYGRWLASCGELVILRSPVYAHVVLRGSVEAVPEGLMFIVTAVAPGLERMRDLGLTLRDFALHDSSAEWMRAQRPGGEGAASQQRELDRLRAILEMGDGAVLYANAQGRVQYVNRRLCELFGIDDSHVGMLTLDAFERHLVASLQADEAERDPLGLLRRRLDVPEAGERVAAMRVRMALPRRATLQFALSATPAGDIVLYFRDITSETEVDRMRSEFLSTAAHELRTPLASIFGFTELLLMRPLDAVRQRELLATIHRQAQLLTKLVNELLDLARIESRQGKDFHRQHSRLATLVERTLQGLLVQGDRRQVDVRMDHGGDAVMVDPEKTCQALLNVLSNAYKYSPDGGAIGLETLRREREGQREVGLRVTDEGIGMTPEQQARIFDRFWRADPSGAIPGTGLGMSLVKEIVELQDGRVQVDSHWGHGTRVTLWFPACGDFALSRPAEIDEFAADMGSP